MTALERGEDENVDEQELEEKEPHLPGGGRHYLLYLSCPLSRSEKVEIKRTSRASLVAQWLRICLPMQGTRVRALVWEDPTCRRATRPLSHNY